MDHVIVFLLLVLVAVAISMGYNKVVYDDTTCAFKTCVVQK